MRTRGPTDRDWGCQMRGRAPDWGASGSLNGSVCGLLLSACDGQIGIKVEGRQCEKAEVTGLRRPGHCMSQRCLKKLPKAIIAQGARFELCSRLRGCYGHRCVSLDCAT